MLQHDHPKKTNCKKYPSASSIQQNVTLVKLGMAPEIAALVHKIGQTDLDTDYPYDIHILAERFQTTPSILLMVLKYLGGCHIIEYQGKPANRVFEESF